MEAKYAVLLAQTISPELLSLLDGYLVQIRGMNFLLAEAFEPVNYFARIEAYKADKSGNTWELLVPLHTVLAAARMDERTSLGFL